MTDGSAGVPFDQVLEQYLSRRGFLRGALAAGSLAVLPGGVRAGRSAGAGRAGALTFASIAAHGDDAVHVPAGYRWQRVLTWGDSLCPGVGPFAAERQSAAEQASRFGFNCDFNGYFPLPAAGGHERGLLVVNHEYPRGTEMFADHDPEQPAAAHVAIEMQAVGMSVVEIARAADGRWECVLDSTFNRRITATDEHDITGPAAGHELLQTAADPTGRRVLGCLSNCSGGKTPWGTVLSGEENVHLFFGLTEGLADEVRDEVIEFPHEPGQKTLRSWFGWELHDERFDLSRHPREQNRFGWVVELDPFDPRARPRKRTALGRFRHEAATCVLADDRRVVVYSGDDERLQFVYKFVSRERFDPLRPQANLDLLDHGTLYVARFDPDGSGEWLPLVPAGPLAGMSQAEILVRTRASAAALGATPMDRPEDVEVNPVNRRVYMTMTKDGKRAAGDPGSCANPRPGNRHGHVIELTENGGDLGAVRFTWSIFLLCGPSAEAGAQYGPWPADEVDVLSCPDNLAFDGAGNLWIATDGQDEVQATNDALFAVATAGPERYRTRRFLTGPVGAEICGPEFTPDGRTLFVSIQHPGEFKGVGQPGSSRWPDGGDGPPRPAVIAVWREDGGVVGT